MNKKRILFLALYCLYVLFVVALIIYRAQIVLVLTVGYILVGFPVLIYLHTMSGINNMAKVRGKFYSMRTRSHAKNTWIAENFRVSNPKQVKFGDNVVIGKFVDMLPVRKGKDQKTGGLITIGNNVSIGDYNRFACKDGITIGDDVLFAAHVHMTDHSHEFHDVTRPVKKQGVYGKGEIVIESGAWLGCRTEILSGVRIGKNSVVAAGAVVTKDVPPYTVVGGCPAKVISKYNFTTKEWER